MATKKVPASDEIYQIEVTLPGSDPPISRLLLVRADTTLGELHSVLQPGMGWENCHMHYFRAGAQRHGAHGFDGDPETKDENKVRVSDLLRRIGAKAVYTYDFGDDWRHAIVLKKRLAADPKMNHPVCIGGRGACPPEDCGGIWGYYDMLDAIQDPEHERHDEFREWLGEEFDPDAFSIDEVNRRLARLRPRTGKAARGWVPPQ